MIHVKLPLMDHLNYDQVIVDPLYASKVAIFALKQFGKVADKIKTLWRKAL